MHLRRHTQLLALVLALATGALAAPSVASARSRRPLAPFGHSCVAEYHVRFCPTTTLAQRVPSFDGLPLDVDVTLPATGRGPFPTIVMLHGWTRDKTQFEATSPADGGNETYDYNNIYYALHGYAVVNYSARGWGNSCGTLFSRATPGCQEGWFHFADQRYEARDTQFLLGELVDEHIAKPGHLGVTGVSYGGGQAIELAYLKNRIRLPDGEFEQWRSLAGTPLAINAAWARWPWSDIVAADWPNGRFLDTEIAPAGQSREPIGVELQEHFSGTAAVAEGNGYMAPPGLDPEVELMRWGSLIGTGEANTTEAATLINQIYTYHQGYGLPGKPAPLLLQSGWTDSLFPPEQSLRVYNAIRAQRGQVALQVGDLGHPPASNKENENRAFDVQGARFFAAELRHQGKPPASGSVTAYTLTCPEQEPAGGPYTAPSWPALHPGRIGFGSAATQTFTSAGGNPALAAAFNPGGGTTEACMSVPAEDEPNTATYTMTSPGFTLMGMPTITATIRTVGPDGELASRLWDVLPDGQQRLIDRGVYRLTDDQQDTITFQLHGDGYRFADGDTVELELLGSDSPYYQASNSAFSVEVRNLTVSLPTTASTRAAGRDGGSDQSTKTSAT